MSNAKFQFKDVRLDTPHDNLCAAIGLIQSQILASDTGLDPKVMFGNYHFPHSNLETAVAMLVALLGEAEGLTWGKDPQPA